MLISLLTVIFFLAVILTKVLPLNIRSRVVFVNVDLPSLFFFALLKLSPVPVGKSSSGGVLLRSGVPALMDTLSGSNNHSLAPTVVSLLMNKSCPDVSTKPPVSAISLP